MNISTNEFERRHRAIREVMKQEGLDCLLVVGLADDFNRGNIRYITGSGRGGFCIFPREGKPTFLIGLNQSTSPKIRKTVGAHELLELKETNDFITQVKQEITHFCHGERVGIVGMSCIPVPMYLAMNEKIPEKLADASNILEPLRRIKSPEEVTDMRIAAGIADNIFDMLRKIIRPGLSDYEIYGRVKKMIYAAGCEYSFDLIDAEGTRMNMTYFPTGERLKANSTLFMEITPAYDGYYAQLPVTLPVGRCPPRIREMVDVWEKASQAVLPLLRPGTIVSDIYFNLINTVRENGFISPLRPGHSIGLDALDFWSITEDNKVVLEPGVTLAVHPSVMTKIGGDACGMGYTYLITDNGAEKFSKIDLSWVE